WTPEWQALARGAAAVCFGTLAQRSPESRATIHHFLEAATHALRVYDINLRPPYYARHWIDASLAQASVLKLNEDEWVHVNELLEIRAADAQDFCRAIMDRYQVSYVFL